MSKKCLRNAFLAKALGVDGILPIFLATGLLRSHR